MPAIELMDREQTALCWEAETLPGDDGQTLVSSTPIELRVRWVEADRQVTGPQGTPLSTSVTVIVDQAISTGSIMWLGGLDDLPGTSSEPPEEGLMEVISSSVTPDLKARHTRYELGLAVYNDTLPVSET